MKNDKETIMVVDDSRSVRSRIGEMLAASGFHVVLAEDGRDCLEKLKDQDVEMIISDVEMPRLDGMGLCQAVREDPHLRQLYFIMLTRRSEVEYKVQGLKIGADDYIVKTTHPEEFLARVNAGMRLRRVEKELRRTQAHLFHSEKMASIGQLAAGLAHEINNPLGFVISNLGTLGKYFDRLSGFVTDQGEALAAFPEMTSAMTRLESQKKELKIDRVLTDGEGLIQESLEGAQRIAKIVNRIRSFMQIEEYECRPADLNQCIELAIDLLLNDLKFASFVHKNYGELPLTRCFPHPISQVIFNLLTNAIQAIGESGEISVTTWCAESSIYFSIADTGCGIPSSHLGRIFDPFFTTREVGKGLGLGLTVAYDIVKKHDGEISVDSVPGLGTTFTVRLPVRP